MDFVDYLLNILSFVFRMPATAQKIRDYKRRRNLLKQVKKGMTPDVVRSIWGMPMKIDRQELSRPGRKVMRYVYGIPGEQNTARYVWFANDKVRKVGSFPRQKEERPWHN